MHQQRPILQAKLNFPICLAPMVGLSHVALRLLVRRYLPQDAKTIWPTEMLNSRRVPSEALGKTNESFRGEEEEGLVPQILGNEENHISATVKKLQAWGAEAIDINMGCPVRKALKHNYGVALMGDPQYAFEIVNMTVRHTKLPVSVKIRAGHSKDPEFLLNFVTGLEKAGASWICLHPRIAAQKRKGSADWSQIKLVRENSSLPIIGNGDVQIIDDVFRMQEQTNCDAVMVGRALSARPWMMWQYGYKKGFQSPSGFQGPPPETPEDEAYEYGRSILYFIEQLEKFFDEEAGMKRLRFHVKVSHPWLNFGHAFMTQISRCKTYEDAKACTTSFFKSSGLRLSHYTSLRY